MFYSGFRQDKYMALTRMILSRLKTEKAVALSGGLKWSL